MRLPLFEHFPGCQIDRCSCYLEFDDDVLPDTDSLFFRVSPHVQGWSSSDLLELVHQIFGVHIGGGTSRNMSTTLTSTTVGGSLIERDYSSWVALHPVWALCNVSGSHREAAYRFYYTAYYDGDDLQGFRLSSADPAYARPEVMS